MKKLNLHYFDFMSKYLKPHLLKLIFLMLGVTISIGLQLFNPQLIRFFIDSALAGKPTDVLINAALIFISIAFLQQLLVVGTAYLSKKIGWQATNSLRSAPAPSG